MIYTHERDLPRIEPEDYLLHPGEQHAFRQTPHTRVFGPILEGKPLLQFEGELHKLKEEQRKTTQDYALIAQKTEIGASALKELLDDLDQKVSQIEPALEQAERLYKQLQKSLAIVHIALALNTFENPHFAKKSFYFSESGNFQGIANYFQYNWYSMGLQPFEEGIFLKNGSETFTPRPHTYLCYLTKTPPQILAFIYLVALLEQDQQSDIEIYLPRLQLTLNSAHLNSLSIGKVLVNGNAIEINTNKQKVLHLHHVLPLPSKEFSALLQASADIVGCTGDHSLSECLTLSKVPFYEVRAHKLETVQAFIQIAKGKNLFTVAHYFEKFLELEKETPESFAAQVFICLTLPAFKGEWEQLLKFIREEYCFEDALIAHLNRHFHFILKPELKEIEDRIVMQVLQQQISAEEAYATLEKVISSLLS